MKTPILISLLGVLVLWMVATMIRIEILNAEAGWFLPRADGGEDGKWCVSMHKTPRDRLRSLVETVGLLQYPLSMTAIALGMFLTTSRFPRAARVFARTCCVAAATCLTMAIYRGYFSSLGW